MENLFKKVAVFTDLHFGLKSNSDLHNNDCMEYIKWFIQTAADNGCETCIFMGDYNHNRANLHLKTMQHSIDALELLGLGFKHTYIILGNHDLHLKDRRDIHSTAFGRFIPGITLIDVPTTIGNVTLCPWLIGNEWKAIGKSEGRYIFGHFELPGFFLNSMVQMPDTEEISNNQFKAYELAFSGHFHKRQTIGNITYIGNAFPHNYADAGDDERGMMILEWGGIPEYKAWENQPTYRTYKLSEIITTPDALLREGMHCRVTIDLPISFEEATYIKETFIPQYKLRELILIPEKMSLDNNTEVIDIEYESVDTIVMSQISTIDSDAFDKNLLLTIYQDL